MENKLRLLGLLVLVSLCLNSCKRKDNVGNGLAPEASNSNIVYTDTLTLLTRTVLEDSIATSELSYNVLGTSDNSVFNLTHASVSAQYFLPRDNFSFGGATKFDSAVLYVGFLANDNTEGNRSFGDITSPQRFSIHELSEVLESSRSYYNNSFIKYDAFSLGSFNGKINLTDSISIVLGSSSKKIPPCLRFKLDDTWAKNKLFNAPSSAFSTNADFLTYFKGLTIASEGVLGGSGGFVYVNLKPLTKSNANTGAALVVYYNDSLSVSFNVSSSARRLNTYSHSIPSAPPFSIPQTYANPGNSFNADTCFIQSMGKYKMKILIPYLYELVKEHKNIAINSAELVVKPYASTLSTNFYAPSILRLLQPNAVTGRNDFIKDIFYAGTTPLNSFYGGSYNMTTGEYRFNFTLHMQELLNDYKATGSKEKNRGLYLIIPTDNPIAASHVIMDTHKGSGIKLEIYYTIQN
ncbi:MAG: DUF4270 family protein [Bacteroidetes bacterium]|nr:DUF4270 family protein [Bacteroidota bacterium]